MSAARANALIWAAIALVSLAVLFAPKAQARHALDHLPCNENAQGQAVTNVAANQVIQAVSEATHHAANDQACQLSIYNGGAWSSYNELKGHVAQVMDSCTAAGETGDRQHRKRHLTQAIVEVTGMVPGSYGADSAVCNVQTAGVNGALTDGTWQRLFDETYDTTGGDGDILFDLYRCTDLPSGCNGLGMSTATISGIQTALSHCSSKAIALASMEAGAFPEREEITMDPSAPPLDGFSPASIGRCFSGWYGYRERLDLYTLRRWAFTRFYSNTDCDLGTPVQRSLIEQAYYHLGLFYPVRTTPPTQSSVWQVPAWDECDPKMYKGGSWGTFDDLKNAIFAAHLCENPWIGQIYVFYRGRVPNGTGNRGECNPDLYWGIAGWYSLETVDGFNKLRSAITGEPYSVATIFANNNVSLGSDGSMTLAGQFYFPPGDVDVVRPDGLIGVGAGNLIGVDAGHVRITQDSALINLNSQPLIAVGGGDAETVLPPGQVIAVGAGNLIAVGAGNFGPGGGLIAVGAGNLIGVGAGHLIGVGAGNLLERLHNLIGVGAGNLIGVGAGNVMPETSFNGGSRIG